ncbi:MAG: 23S rRNA (adenine(2503)-C(2))-methyltransferase RlmN [Desulfovibrionaceae bacterium]
MFDILNMSFKELEEYCTNILGEPSFRAKQVWKWLWQKRIKSFSEMTNVAKRLREYLEEHAVILYPEIADIKKSNDGTIKFLLRLEDGEIIETVLIPTENKTGAVRMTQCLSSQVGCAMACTFCSTGTMGFIRNMSMREILGQILIVKDYIKDYSVDTPIIRNFVFMGMGEPLLNCEALLPSLRILNDRDALCYSPRKITVSTSGIKRGLEALSQENLAYIAISLHSPFQKTRAEIMPKASKWGIEEIICFLEKYPLQARAKITLEYVLLQGVNDSIEDAIALAKIALRLKAKVNLINYNPSATDRYKTTLDKDVLSFEKVLWKHKIITVLRKSKGLDIQAACGQLVYETKNKKRVLLGESLN